MVRFKRMVDHLLTMLQHGAIALLVVSMNILLHNTSPNLATTNKP
jgi:hypothetical protein